MIDFDIHGLAVVRVVGDDDDVRIVEKQLGPLQRPSTGDADITVEFVDRLDVGQLVMLGRDEWAYDDEGLVVLRGKRKSRIRARIPLDTVGDGCHVVIERGAPAVPYLVALVNLCVLSNGGLALHAAAFEHRGVGVVVTGWSKGGKTESLLAALEAGARYVGDEWVYFDRDGARATGVPEPVRIWDWYVDQLHAVRPSSGTFDRTRSVALSSFVQLSERVERSVTHSGVTRTARRLRHLADEQRHRDVPVSAITGSTTRPEAIDVDVVVHSISAEVDEYAMTPTTGADVAARMAGSLAFERLPLMGLYHAFRYAFPDRHSALIESAADLERDRLTDFLSDKQCWISSHDYPPELDRLGSALSPLWEGT